MSTEFVASIGMMYTLIANSNYIQMQIWLKKTQGIGGMPRDFELIRSWDGSKDRAFEEICYQLLREPEDLPPDIVGRPVRTGNPDGGVEWYILTARGEQWGWQAKYITSVDKLLNAMTVTVKRVVIERPQLTKLIFCVPGHLSGGTAKGKQKSGRQKFLDKVATWKDEIKGAKKIDFDIIDGSDLLDRLAMPKHAGRRWFWWNEPYLGPDWLADFQRDQVYYADKRYHPKLDVDIPIQNDLAALGFAESYFEELQRYFDLAFKRLGQIGSPPEGIGDELSASAEILAAAITQFQSLGRVNYQAENADPLQDLAGVVEACIEAVESVSTAAEATTAGLLDKPAEEGYASTKERIRYYIYGLRGASNALYNLGQFLDNSATRAVGRRFYFLSGAGGIGKTHLCLEAADRALQEGRPAVVLFGGLFGTDLWSSVCNQLKLPLLGGDDLLGALEAAAEACSPTARRFVVMIDALNDTKVQDYWADRLPALMAAFAARPLLSLLVSCRDNYLDYVDPDARRKGFDRIHPGFAGREFEATQKYFNHFNLRAPSIPLLLPEFTVPLFLLTYCQGLHDQGRSVPPAGHEGRMEIFERFLGGRLDRARQKLGLSTTTKVRAALDALLREMSVTGRDSIKWDRAELLATAQIPERTEWPRTALGTLLSEGLVSREMIYQDGELVEGVRITYQAFSDFLILRHRMADATIGSPPNAELSKWLKEASAGIQEAAAVLLPERYGIELPDLLERLIRGNYEPDSPESRRASYRMNVLDQLAVRSLPYRSADAVTDRSIELLNRYTVTRYAQKDALDVFLLCAPQPDSRLNADGLHDWLSRFSMPQRDEAVGMPLYYELDDESSPLSRLARWAAAGPYPEYGPRIIELACIPLVWMLASPNRFMRDWITKALARLLAGHLDVATYLLAHLAKVNDPYVLERLVTVIYGAVLRGGAHHPAGVADLAHQVKRLIFERLDQLTPDALMLDAARGIIEFAVAKGLIPHDSLRLARAPYGLPQPGNPPTRERLETLYPSGEGINLQTSCGSIFHSMYGLGDFGRYVVESGIHHFARVPSNKPMPAAEPLSRPRFLPKRYEIFKKSLSPKRASQATTLFEINGPPSRLDPRLWEFEARFTKRQRELLEECWWRPKPRPDMHYPGDRARRWVLWRAMALGWTPQRFGEFDHSINYSRIGRESHKAERFGKKYQWIAYHELLARVADNYHYMPGYGAEPRAFDGVYEINDREIDPSLPPVPYREFQKRIAKQGTWQPTDLRFPDSPPGAVDFGHWHDYQGFLDDQETLPFPHKIARLTDMTDEPWIVLDARLNQAALPEDGDRKLMADRQFYSLASWLAAPTDVRSITGALPGELQRHAFNSHLIDMNGHIDCCYFGELGWRQMNCPYRHDGPVTVTTDEVSFSITPTVERYIWEGITWDCSIEDTVRATLPSTYVQCSSQLRWSGDGCAWLDGNQVVMCNIDLAGADRHGEMLVVKEDWLRNYLTAQNMTLVFAVQGQREHRDGESDFVWVEFFLTGSYRKGKLRADSSLRALKSTRDA